MVFHHHHHLQTLFFLLESEIGTAHHHGDLVHLGGKRAKTNLRHTLPNPLRIPQLGESASPRQVRAQHPTGSSLQLVQRTAGYLHLLRSDTRRHKLQHLASQISSRQRLTILSQDSSRPWARWKGAQ